MVSFIQHPSLTLVLALAFRCTLFRTTVASTPEPGCTLNCENGGTCRWRKSSESQLRQNQMFKYMACDCRFGFSGETCNIPVVRCPDGGLCFYGSTCIKEEAPADLPDEQNDSYVCDCSSAPPDIVVIGDMCQHVETQSCEAGVALSRRSFCTNGGRCREVISADSDVHLGCDCPEGFNGPYCEVAAEEFSVGLPGEPASANDFYDSLSDQEYLSIVGRNIAIGIGCFIAVLACAGVFLGSMIVTGGKSWDDNCVFSRKSGEVEPSPEQRSENMSSSTDSMDKPGGKILSEDSATIRQYIKSLPRRSASENDLQCNHALAC